MKILHTADLHLGFKQYGFQERAEDFMLATAYVFKMAEKLGVELVILAGDQFQSVHPPAESVYFLYTCVHEAEAKGIKVYGIDGNHDASSDTWLRVCGVRPLQSVTYHGSDISIVGFNGAAPSVLRAKMQELATKVHCDVVVLHTEIAEMCGYAGVDLTAAEVSHILRPAGVRLVLMGHIHDYKEAEIGGIRFIYSGSVEMTAKGEQPEKSFSVIDINKDHVQTAMYPIPTRPVFDVCIKTEPELDNLLADLTKAKDATQRMPMAIIYYDKNLPDFGKRAEALLQGKVLYRLIPQSLESIGKSDIFTQLNQQTFERKGALRNLKDVLEQTFGSSDEGVLVARMMDNPDQVYEIAMEYAKSKGLDIK